MQRVPVALWPFTFVGTGRRFLLAAALLACLASAATLAASGSVRAAGWRAGPPMQAARWAFALLELPSGRLLAAGGVPSPDARGPLGPEIHGRRAELLDPSWRSWTEITPMPGEHRWQQQALRLASGRVMLVGEHPAVSPGQAHFFDEATGAWSSGATLPAERRFGAELLALDDDRLLYLAGYDGANLGRTFASAEIYRPSTDRWEPTGSLAQARFGLRAARLESGPLAGQILACGGVTYQLGAAGGLVARNSCEVYDPAQGRWSPGPAMGVERGFFTLTRLRDGRLLAAGGWTQAAGSLADCEIMDPTTLTWQATGSLPLGLSRHTATLLPSGRVLLTGGGRSDLEGPSTATAFFDPGTGAWTDGPAMLTARSDHGAHLGADGRLLVAGGRGPDGEALAATEILELGRDGDPPAPPTATPDPTPTATTAPPPSATAPPSPSASPAPPQVPSPTLPPPSPAAPTSPPSAARVCPQLAGRAPAEAIARALAEPARVMGYGLLVDPGKPASPANPRRSWLSLHSYGKPYAALGNALEWKGGCP